MNSTHVSEVAELEKMCFSAPWSEKSVASELENPLSLWLVATEQDRVLGYVGSQTVLGESDMMNLAVDPDFRRQGIGEALVLLNPALKEDFRYILKQNGGMLAKGRLLGIQFEELFRDDLYMELSRHADTLAAELRALFRAKNIPVLVESPTNQLFPILPNAFLKSLSQNFTFSVQFPIDPTHTCIRLCTSWSTPRQRLEALAAAFDHTDFESGSDSKST